MAPEQIDPVQECDETLRDPARVAAVRRLQLLDTPPEESFDRLTRLGARVLDVPVAWVNLVDGERQFFKSAVGLGEIRELPAETSVCQYPLASRAPLLIEDARLDPRFATKPGERGIGLVAYMGIPLITPSGHAVGTFCVVDHRPRQWNPEELQVVKDLAAMAMTEIDLRIAQRELESERVRLEAIFEQAPAFMATAHGPDFVFERANAHYDQVVGHRDIIGKAVAEALPELEAQGILEILEGVYATGEPYFGNQMPIKLQREAGGPLEERILNLVYQPIRESDGAISGILAHGVDVTDQARAQEKVVSAEAHYRRLVNNSPQTIYGQDRHGVFTDFNPAGERMIGMTSNEIQGRHFADVVHPNDLPIAEGVFSRLMSGESEQEDYELRVSRPDGDVRLLVITAAGIREGEGSEVVGVQGIARDITAEREAEDQIRLLAAALQSLSEGVTIARLDGQIIYSNAAHARLLGYDPGERPFPNAREFLPDEESAKQLEAILDRVVEDGAWTGRLRRRRKDDGRIVPLEMIVGSVDRGSSGLLIITISRDISREIERENHLRRTERLASLGTLVGGVAHELNNPLQSIQSFAELLVEEAESERVKEDLQTIQREASRAARIVADLRLLARSTQDEPAPRTSVDLNDVVQHVLHTRRYALATRNIVVRTDVAADLPSVLADRSQVEQVLLNLIVNAEQAMEGREDASLSIRTSASGGVVSLCVADTGSGIERHQVERIFDPFWTTKDPGEGTGLGLSLVHSIVMEHGGVVRVESTPGKGSEFRVELPAARPSRLDGPKTIASPDVPPPDAARSLRVLVVDDEEAVRRVFARVLTIRGHDVELAGDGAEALKLLTGMPHAASFDVIVSDLRMPGLDGEALFKRLRELGTGLERKVIFMTGDAVGENATRVLTALGAPVIYKPMKLQEAALLIESHADAIA